MDEHLTNIVVCGLIARDGKIFVPRRAQTKATFPGTFELVGGHADPGEQPVAALEREIREELGVEVEVGMLIDAFTYTSESTFKIEICYLCTLKDPTVEPVLNAADHSEARWIGPDEIALFEKDDEETAVLRKAFKVLKGNE